MESFVVGCVVTCLTGVAAMFAGQDSHHPTIYYGGMIVAIAAMTIGVCAMAWDCISSSR